MKTEINGLIEKLKRPIQLKFRNKFSVFVICLLISVFLWFLVKMPAVDSSEINYPLKFTNVPEGKILTWTSNNQLKISLIEKGTKMISYGIFNTKDPLFLSLKNIRLEKKDGFYQGYILTSNMVTDFERQLSVFDAILSIYPDTIQFRFEDIMTKKVPVKLNISYDFAPQFKLYGPITITPDSIVISGLMQAVDTIYCVPTIPVKITNIDKTQELNAKLEIKATDNTVDISSTSINVYIPVEEFTESIIAVPIGVNSTDTAINLKTFPEQAEITYHVFLKDYHRVKPGMFKAVVTFSPVAKNNNILAIDIIQKPEFVTITGVNPAQVEYIILK